MSESKGQDTPRRKLIEAASDHQLSPRTDWLVLALGDLVYLLTVLFVGKQGIGKSSLGNTVACIGEEDPCFPTAASFANTTTGADAVRVGCSLLVDTQGQGGIHCGSEFDLRLMRALSSIASAVVEVMHGHIDSTSYDYLLAQLEMYRSYSLREAPPVLIVLRTHIASEGVTLAQLIGEEKYTSLTSLCRSVTLVVVPELSGPDLEALQTNTLVSKEASLGEAGKAYLAGARAVAQWLKEQADVLADSMLTPQDIGVLVQAAVAAVNEEVNMAPMNLASRIVMSLFKSWLPDHLAALTEAVDAATRREDISHAEARFFACCAAWARKYNDTPGLVPRLRAYWVAHSKPVIVAGRAALLARQREELRDLAEAAKRDISALATQATLTGQESDMKALQDHITTRLQGFKDAVAHYPEDPRLCQETIVQSLAASELEMAGIRNLREGAIKRMKAAAAAGVTGKKGEMQQLKTTIIGIHKAFEESVATFPQLLQEVEGGNVHTAGVEVVKAAQTLHDKLRSSWVPTATVCGVAVAAIAVGAMAR